jgi:hypothetical protein
LNSLSGTRTLPHSAVSLYRAVTKKGRRTSSSAPGLPSMLPFPPLHYSLSRFMTSRYLSSCRPRSVTDAHTPISGVGIAGIVRRRPRRQFSPAIHCHPASRDRRFIHRGGHWKALLPGSPAAHKKGIPRNAANLPTSIRTTTKSTEFAAFIPVPRFAGLSVYDILSPRRSGGMADAEDSKSSGLTPV